MRRIADIKAASAVLQWDQETYLPQGGAHFRGQQISTLSELAHGLFSEDSLGDLLRELVQKEELTPAQKRNVERTLEDYKKNKKYTSAFVRALSEQINKTFHAWIEARKQNSFSVYEKDLDALIKLKKEETQILGFVHHPYDALLDEYEKGATVSLLDKTFATLLPPLEELFQKITAAPQVDSSFLHQHFPEQQQWQWGLHLIKQLHFDFEKGRQDKSEHPFSTSFSPQDVRITTRIDENDFGNMTWSCIHETGHALYEQGLPDDQYGLPLGEACSYSIHESQSRLWENNVGRSKDFWQFYYPQLQQYFPGQFHNVDLERFYKGINKVQPSLIRTEADEISYHFHVFIRYELEKKLIEGALATADIPVFWNEGYKTYLGVTVPDDKRGCLQDVHWSHGSFGYFPTYSLGSFYAAQFFAKAKNEIATLSGEITEGNTESLLQWLRTKIHSKGRYFTSEGLCKDITGEGLNGRYFLNYAQEKYTGIYTN
ncbi:carboxypeptidase M32 [Flavisolibacter ginsenosidimutans]|uniref:Metal-dependent carboxypeptidase n=1 Tax=Flavisolibacter ginsenosidimutans TaxID=661481 RepID=A0A5B8UKF8_9BACT|nr:carboxypeptidase M32 [Flavisolibacter ginsenosidimutans]QEC56500.1 carboxypeptidase M32 [Flavisolibacter ginsenosidimutans]